MMQLPLTEALPKILTEFARMLKLDASLTDPVADNPEPAIIESAMKVSVNKLPPLDRAPAKTDPLDDSKQYTQDDCETHNSEPTFKRLEIDKLPLTQVADKTDNEPV